MPEDGSSDTGGQIPTNLRLLMVLEEIVQAGVPITPTAANASLGLPKPTVHRLFHTLEAEGFLQRDIDGKAYSPGWRLRKLSVNTLSSLHIRTARLAILKSLADKIGETCNLATPDREAMLYLDRVETKWPLRIQLPVGTTVPFYCTAAGKMYLSSLTAAQRDKIIDHLPLVRRTRKTITDPDQLRAEIREIHKRGYSTDNEEFMEGMAAIAVPVKDDLGRLLATLSVHAPIQRQTKDDLMQFRGLLASASEDLSNLLLSR
ncbi:MAG: IclR family transcriptional regulator [Pseudomonadota bacterium]